MKKKTFPTKQEINKLLDFNPSTGVFKWKNTPCKRWKKRNGTVAGYVNKRGYRIIGINGKLYRSHRIAWYIHNNYKDYEGEIDHINRNTDDNRVENLRRVNTQENAKNRKLVSNSTSGVLGVYWHKRQKKWNAGIKINGKQIYLGSFSEKKEAEKARLKANKKYNFHPNHGKKTETIHLQ